MTLNFNLRRAMAHAHANTQGQRSVGSKVRVETAGHDRLRHLARYHGR